VIKQPASERVAKGRFQLLKAHFVGRDVNLPNA
jgi:hypothetical protein